MHLVISRISCMRRLLCLCVCARVCLSVCLSVCVYTCTMTDCLYMEMQTSLIEADVARVGWPS